MTHPPDVEIMRKTCPSFWGVKDTPDMERRHAIARIIALLIILAVVAFVIYMGTRKAGAEPLTRPVPAASSSPGSLRAVYVDQQGKPVFIPLPDRSYTIGIEGAVYRLVQVGWENADLPVSTGTPLWRFERIIDAPPAIGPITTEDSIAPVLAPRAGEPSSSPSFNHREKALEIMHRVHQHMKPGPSAVAKLSEGKGPRDAIKKRDIWKIGIGNCQDYALVMVRLCRKEGITAVVLDVATQDGLAHTVVEIEERPGVWRVYDPLLDLRYRASGQDMIDDPISAKLPPEFKPDETFKKRGYASYCGPGFWTKVKWGQARGYGRIWWEVARGAEEKK